MMTARFRARAGRRSSRPWYSTPRKRAVLVLLFATVAFVAIGGFTIFRDVAEVRKSLVTTQELADNFQGYLESEDIESAKESIELLVAETSYVRSISSSPSWRVASSLPFVGENFNAVTIVAVSANEIVADVVAPLLNEYEALDLDQLAPKNGAIDIGQIGRLGPVIDSAAKTLSYSETRIAAINVNELVPELASPVSSLKERLGTITPALETASTAARLLPLMLGTESPRSYLVLIQNNAEVRATGGIPGALAILNANEGRISLDDQSSAAELGEFIPPVDVDQEQQDLFTTRLGRHMQNVNLTPDFPTAALTAKRMWEERYPDKAVDGVFGIDPVVLSSLLNATGPVPVDDPQLVELVSGTGLPTSITSENVVPTLLSDVYREIEDPILQDVYFASVASGVFGALTGGQSNSSKLLDALASGVEENRVNLWSSSDYEQDLISGTALAGAVTGSNAGGAAFGMYFNDGTGAKMDYYAERRVQLVKGCRSDGYGEFTVHVSMSNTAPADAERSIPTYVTGGGLFGVKAGNIRTNYVAYGPAQSLLKNATLNGEPVSFASGMHGQRPVGTVTVELAPGQRAELEVSFFKVVQDSEPRLSVTPSSVPQSEAVMPLKLDPSCT